MPELKGEPTAQPTLSLCMITTGQNKDSISACLDSVKDLVDEIILCVDDLYLTGTEIDNRFPDAKVSTFTWEDSFAKARNVSLEQATCDWILILDSDNVLDPEAIPVIQAFVKQDKYNVGDMQIIHKKPVGESMNWGHRIFRRGIVHYEGRKHNQAIFEGPSVHLAAKIYHFGFNLPADEQRKKDARDERLILMQIEEEPDNLFHFSSLVRNYRCKGEYENVLEMGKEGLDNSGKTADDTDMGYWHSYQMLMADMTYACIETNRVDEGLEYAMPLLAEFPRNLDMQLYAGHLHLQKEEWRRGVNHYRQYLELLPQYLAGNLVTSLTIDSISHEPQAWNNTGTAYAKMGRWTASARAFKRALELEENPNYKDNYIAVLEQEQKQIRKRGRVLKVLFVQKSACIRNVKQAIALSQRHQVGLAYQVETSQRYGLSEDMYCETIKIPHTGDVGTLCAALRYAGEDYDVIHIHNEPDTLTNIALMVWGGIKPIIHDCHDLLTVRGSKDGMEIYGLEHLAMKYADALVFVSEEQARQAHSIHNIATGKALVLPSYTSAAFLPKEFKPKLSEDGKVHLVYEGGLRLHGHRDCRGFFQELADNSIHIHIYPAFHVQEYADLESDYIHYYQPLPPDQLATELTRYDAGLIPLMVDDTTRVAKSVSLPNKLYEYLCSGLPVIARDLPALKKFITDNECGRCFNTASDIVYFLGNDVKWRQVFTTEQIQEFQKKLIMEANIGILERTYWDLLR